MRENPDTVFIGGGYEFAKPGADNGTSPDTVGLLGKAYAMLGYDIFLLSPTDALAIGNAGLKLPKGWQPPLDKPRVVTRTVQGGSLAFVLFPDTGRADAAQEAELVELARSLRAEGRHNLIVGVSTWGSPRENDFILSREPVFDIVLGSGEGPGYAGIYLQDNRVLWVRAFTRGKSVHTVTIPALPAPGVKAVWDPEVSVTTLAAPLGDGVAADPEVEAIFRP
jgi:hypothetical protein